MSVPTVEVSTHSSIEKTILACIRIRHCLTSSSSKEHQFVEFG